MIFQKDKPKFDFIKSSKLKKSLMNAYSESNRTKIYHDIGPMIQHFLKNSDSKSPYTVLEFIKGIPNVKNLKSEDLVGLFELIRKVHDNQISENPEKQLSH